MLLFLESIGIGEIVVIFFFILIFFGADSIPGIARKLGRGIRQIKDMTQDIQDEITKVTYDMRKDLKANEALKDAKEAFENPAKKIAKNLNQEGGEISKALNNSIRFEKKKPITPVSSGNITKLEEDSSTYKTSPLIPESLKSKEEVTVSVSSLQKEDK